ncbi:MAG: exodeoxyribonuclease VII small subunit [Ruminococcus sp.]|nr:exodeoxyribonuclease VII small subunit [Ruminococcus sp.]
MAKKKSEMNMEEAFEALETLVEQMESGEASLEETFLMYQKGMELLKECSSKIDMVEKKMMLLNENGELHEF